MVSGILIPANTNAPVKEVQFDDLQDYQTAVGGPIEAIDLQDLGVTMFINEVGRLENLPYNARAMFLWWWFVPAVRQKEPLLGDVVIVGLPDSEGNSQDVPEDARRLILSERELELVVIFSDEMRSVELESYWEALVWAMLIRERSHDLVAIYIRVRTP